MKKFKSQYRIPSARLQSWDYGQNGGYFITICTKNRECSFGDVVDGKMQLSQTGQLAERFCKEIPHHFPYIKLGRYVVMPNHLHIIIIICKSDDHVAIGGRDAINRVSTGVMINRVSTGGITQYKNPMLHDNLSRIICWYKGRVTFESRKINIKFAWQSRFHDHIIRNEKSFNEISEYVKTNPQKWENDKFYARRRD